MNRTVSVLAMICVFCCTHTFSPAADPSTSVDIGSRRELFIDRHLIDRLDGARLQLQRPQPREIAIVHDEPWEGTGCGYHSIFKDGDLYRMYYKAWNLDVKTDKLTIRPQLFCCYAESDDGVHWRKPKLGLHEFNGSKQNNIVMASEDIGEAISDPGHCAVFKDQNPDVPADAQYKAIIRSKKPHGLLAFKSPDGLRWTPLSNRPVITNGAFDSQNLAFWDPVRKEYRAYWRYFTKGVTTGDQWKPGGVRAIRTATSKDFVNWSNETDLSYVDSPSEQLYTNQIKPYDRAPHLLLGFPTRYVERGWSDSMQALPESKFRQWRARAQERYGTALTEGMLMSSRDGMKFHRWNEAFLRPGTERPHTWHYGQQYIAWHVVETESSLEGAPNELSIYASESYWHGTGSKLRRFTLRLDGFVSVSAGWKGGRVLTRPLVFAGERLQINFASSAAGSVRIEIQDDDGNPIDGFSLADCPEIFGDSVDRSVTWGGGADVSSLAGRPVRLLFELKDADLYSLQFQSGRSDQAWTLDAKTRQRCIAVLDEGMRADDFWPSIHAAEGLTLAGQEKAVRAFLGPKLGAETDDQKRCGLARELVRAGDQPRSSVMVDILRGADSHGHVHAAESLYKVGWKGDRGPVNRAFTDSDDVRLRLMAAAAIAKHASGSIRNEAFAFLREQLRDNPDPDVFRLAAWVLGRIGEAKDRALIRTRIDDAADNELVQAFLIHALAALGDVEGTQALLRNLESSDPAIRTYAAVFAGESGTVAAAPLLIRQLEDANVDARIRAAQALIELAR